MGSGCNSGCRNDFQQTKPDTSIEYTGSPAPSLGICTHDRLNEVLQVTIQKIVDYASGIGISLPDIDLTTCDAFANCITCCGTCTDLPCLMECYKNAICSIFDDVKEIKDQVNTLLNGPYDTGCLDNVTSASPLNAIIQEMILELCALETALNTLTATVSGFTSGINTTIGNFLNGALTSCQGTQVLNKTGSGASLQFSLRGFCPIGTVMPYAGDPSKFDNSGLGYSNTDCCGWAMCNGNNGTVNMSGLIPVGTGMGPAVITGMVFPYNTTGGEYSHTLTANESGIPSHGHGVNEGIGHSHPMSYLHEAAGTGNGVQVMNPIATADTLPWYDASTGTTNPATGPNPFGVVANVGRAKTGITVNNSTAQGANSAHNNVQPYRALYYIQRVS